MQCSLPAKSYYANQDGNGRVGRLLSSIPLLQHGLPPINIMGSSTLNASKKEYVDALVRVRFCPASDSVAALTILAGPIS
jgi:Fic family protein